MTCLVTCRTAATAKPIWGTVKNRSCKSRKWNPSNSPACRRRLLPPKCPSVRQGRDFRPSLTAYCIADGIVSCRQRSRCINPSLVVWAVCRPDCGLPEGGQGDAKWRSTRRPAVCPTHQSGQTGASGHLRCTMAHVVLALASSRSRYRNFAGVARSIISHLAVAAYVV